MFEDVFGFAKNYEEATYGLGYKLTLTRKHDSSVLKKAGATYSGKFGNIVFG